MADPKGKFKCQESAQVPISALFSDDELATFATFVAEEGFEPDQHWRLSPCQKQADCPAAGDPEEQSTTPSGVYYTNNATCVRVSSGRLLAAGAAGAAGSAASSLARRCGPACACPPDEGCSRGVAWRLAAVSPLSAAHEG